MKEGKIKKQNTVNNEEKYYLAYKNLPIPYQSLDKDGRFLDVNVMWCKVLGYGRKEVLGRHFSDFLAPGYDKVFKINFLKFKVTGSIYNIFFEMIKKNGKNILVEYSGQIDYDKKGKFKQTHCVFQDVTKQKETEQNIEHQRKFFESILSGVATGVWVTDKNNIIIYANTAMGKIAGISPKKIEGANVLKDFSEGTLKYFSTKYLKAKRELKSIDYKSIPVVTPAGR